MKRKIWVAGIVLIAAAVVGLWANLPAGGQPIADPTPTQQAAPLPAPEVTVAARAGMVSLTWNKIAGAESYLIYRAQDDGRYEFLTATQDINHLDRTVCGGRRYLYRVAADAGAEARPGRRSPAKGVVAELAAPTGLRVRG
ncbi:MAG: hypothetical protein PHD32_10345, partial [Eubacteriales bacterium]|nr:hypothetical protein [Eubacteriales bacterium]